MPNLDLGGNFPDNQLQSTLLAGLKSLSQNQEITFVSYTRYILPLDGYVFWIKDPSTAPITVLGSFHYNTEQRQELDKTIAYQNIVLTTPVEIADFNGVQPNQIWLGQGPDFQFSFSSHNNYYEQANLWHYTGQAVYPEMYTQVLDDYSQIPTTPIVSNSLPIWMALNNYGSVYPSFLVPENITPPYIVCHIDPMATNQLQPIPLVTAEGTWQLTIDKVRLVVYGMDNQTVQNYLQYIVNSSLDGAFGIMKMGVVARDGKHIQSELNVLGQQKFVDLEISYNQHAVYQTALNYIRKTLPVPIYINPP